MAIRATCTDEEKNVHLLIGLNRENITALLRGEALTLPPGQLPLNTNSRIVLVYAETDDQLESRLPES